MNLWFPENVFFGTLSYSVLLTTLALLFYHMTRVRSLEMTPSASVFFSISLILLSIVYIGAGIVSYHDRLRELMDQNPEDMTILSKEKKYWILYVVLGIVFMLVEMGIAFFIIRGSLSTLFSRST